MLQDGSNFQFVDTMLVDDQLKFWMKSRATNMSCLQLIHATKLHS